MEISYFRLDHVLLWDLLKRLYVIMYQLQTKGANVAYCIK